MEAVSTPAFVLFGITALIAVLAIKAFDRAAKRNDEARETLKKAMEYCTTAKQYHEEGQLLYAKAQTLCLEVQHITNKNKAKN